MARDVSPYEQFPRGAVLPRRRELSLADVIGTAWGARWFMLAGMLVMAVAAVIFILTAQPLYKARVILSPATPMNGSESSSLIAGDNFFALRFLLQNIGNQGNTTFTRFEHSLHGRRTAERLFAEIPDLPVRLSEMRRLLIFPVPAPQNPAELAGLLSDRVRLETLGAGPLKQMVFWHPDPGFAAELLTRLHGTADRIIREDIAKEAQERVTYLRGLSLQTLNPEHRRALTDLLMEQERLLMLVSMEQPYAATVVEPAATGAKPEWPDALLMMMTALAGGALAGFAVYNLRRASSFES